MTVKVEALADDAFHADPAVVLLDDLAADAEAQAGAAVAVLVRLLGRVEWLEDQAQSFGWDAHAGVGHADLHHLRVRVGANVDPQASAPGHRLTGVDDKVEKDLLDLAWNNGGLRPAFKLLLHLHAMLAQVLLGQDQHLVHQAADVGHVAVRRVVAGEPEHAADDHARALASLQDFFQRLGPRLLAGLRLQGQLGIVDDRGEDVVEFVGHAGGQGPHAAHGLGLQELLRSWSVSVLGTMTSSPIMGVASWLSVSGLGGRNRAWRAGRPVRPGNGIGRHAEPSSSEVLAMYAVKERTPGARGGLRAAVKMTG